MKIFLVFLPITLFANPILVRVINEFQTDTTQRIEFHFTYPLGYNYPLLNETVITPPGIAVIDTNIIMYDTSYIIIDTSVLTGSYCLPSDTGFIETSLLYDSIAYPIDSFVPAPPPGASAAKFYCYVNQGIDMEYVEDWYIDFTPTFGDSNDDYSGCRVSGYVYGGGIPVPNALVTAYSELWIYTPHPFYDSAITYTNSEGYYSFDSLLPVSFWINVVASGYQPQSRLTGVLHSLKPLTNFNFELIGILEDNPKNFVYERLRILSLPQIIKDRAQLQYSISEKQHIRLALYDIIGKRVNEFAAGILAPGVYTTELNFIHLNSGIYFLVIESHGVADFRKVVVIR